MAKIDLLSATKVKSLKKPGDYLDGRGLYLQVRNQSSKSWILKYSMKKRAQEMGLGSAFDFDLADARDMRDRYRKLVKLGVDPIEHRKTETAERAAEKAKAVTFKDAATRYIAAAQGLRLSDDRRPARPGDRHRAADESARADLVDEAGDGKPRTRSHRIGNRGRQGPRQI
jgi:hypothetical protein